MGVIDYSNYRYGDTQYRDLLRDILYRGIVSKTQQGPEALTLFGSRPMAFDLRNGFPMITDRDVSSFWRQPIGEICAFINGARTLKQLEDFGCRWWKSWATKEKCKKRGLEEGDLGPGSYGSAFHDFPMPDGNGFNQFKHLVEQIKEFPHLRTHRISPWIPYYTIRGKGKQQKVVVAPCHGDIFVRIIDDELYLTMVQRSGDVPVGVPSNMIQYAALTMMLAQVTGCKAKEYVHTIVDAHIYVDQIPYVREILVRGASKPFPIMKINSSIDDIFAFRKEHFTLSDYNAYPAIKGIPVAI